tara:strand:+ start:1225 stop:1695 length:471 start_codon:yes stop_codon:yes gene_type:complete
MLILSNEPKKRGWILVLVNGGYAIIYGLILGILTGFIAESRIQAAGIIFSSLEEGILNQYLNLTVSTSYLLISFGLFTIYVALTGYKYGSRLSWIFFLTGGGVAWFGLLYSDLLFGSILTIGLDIIGLVTYILAVLIPMKSILLGKWASSSSSKTT